MHKHEWWENIYKGYSCDCGIDISEEDVHRRLNATEELSAEDAKALTMPALLNEEKFQARIDALRAYAERMEHEEAN